MGSCSGTQKDNQMSQRGTTQRSFSTRINSPSSASVKKIRISRKLTTTHKERILELLQPENRRIFSERSFYDEYSIVADKQPNISSGIYKVQHNVTGQIRCAKIQKIFKKKTQIQNDYYHYKQIDHPNFLQVYEFYQTESQIITVFDFCQGVTLKQLMNENYEFSEDELIRLTYQMVSAISYLNSRNLQHFRICPEHIMFVEQSWLFVEQSWLIKLISPELIHQSPEIDQYYQLPQQQQNYDIWSIGIILYQICVGKHPFVQKDIPLEYRQSQGLNSYNFNKLNEINPQLKNLIIRMIQYENRESATQLMKDHYIQQFHHIHSRFEDHKKLEMTLIKSYFNFIVKSTMVHHFASEDQRQSLAIQFLFIDKQAKGFLTKDDLLAIHMDESQIDKLLHHFRGNRLYFNDFISIATEYDSLLSESNIQQLFQLLIRYQRRKSVNLCQIIENTFITQLIEEDLDHFSKQLKLEPYSRIPLELFKDIIKNTN